MISQKVKVWKVLKRNQQFSHALEALGVLLATVVKQQAQINRNIEVNAQYISFNCSAKANSSFEINKPF